MKNQISPKLYSINDACVVLGGVSRTTIYRYIAAGHLKAKKMLGRTYILASSVDELIDAAKDAA